MDWKTMVAMTTIQMFTNMLIGLDKDGSLIAKLKPYLTPVRDELNLIYPTAALPVTSKPTTTA